MVEPQPSKLIMPVRSRSAAPKVLPVQSTVHMARRASHSVRKPSRATRGNGQKTSP